MMADTKYVINLNLGGETPEGTYMYCFRPSEVDNQYSNEYYGLRQLFEPEKPAIAVGGDRWARMAIQLFNHPNADILVDEDFNNNTPR